MDAFMGFVLDALREHGSRAVRVFPPAAGVLVSFADRIATEVVRCYPSCLCHAPPLSPKPRRFLNISFLFSRMPALLRMVPCS
jgi:hypothetical protein